MEKKYITPSSIKGKRIREIRELLHLTQKQFACLIGSSKPTVERWESADNEITGPITLLSELLLRHPELVDEITLPERKLPIRLKYMYADRLCTVIDVDPGRRLVNIRNYTDMVMLRAFGVVERPTYEQYEEFLRSRCFPETRDKMKLELERLGLPFYDPFMIIEKTEGRMSEDDFYILIER